MSDADIETARFQRETAFSRVEARLSTAARAGNAACASHHRLERGVGRAKKTHRASLNYSTSWLHDVWYSTTEEG